MREDYGLQSPHFETVSNKTKQSMDRLPAYLYYHHGHSNSVRVSRMVHTCRSENKFRNRFDI